MESDMGHNSFDITEFQIAIAFGHSVIAFGHSVITFLYYGLDTKYPKYAPECKEYCHGC